MLSRLLRPGANAIVHRVELEAVEKEPQVVDGNLKKCAARNFDGTTWPVGWESDGKWLVSIDLIVINQLGLHEFLEGWPTT